MEKHIITVSRQFGSGGRSVAKLVAERMGYTYYDKELVKQVALETGFDERYVEDRGEHAPSASRLAYSYPPVGAPGVMNGLSAADFLWIIQRQVILNLAEQGNCVIVGRCADYILREREDALHVFVHADMAFRADRIVRLYGESDKSPEKRLQDKDKKRRANYKHYTGRDWGVMENYDACFDSGRLGIETCADVIVRLAKGE